jgi:protein-ribulosamine 3-kinase
LNIPSEIEQALQARGMNVTSAAAVGGGCINQCCKLTTNKGALFLKWNTLHEFPAMLETEARGLTLLRGANALDAPEVIDGGTTEKFQYLLLGYIDSGRRRSDYWQLFAEGLAKLHSVSAGTFGLDHNNYIGSLPQDNSKAHSWITFFVEQRLSPQLRMAQRIMDRRNVESMTKFMTQLPSLLCEERPALVHGDLWGGNLMTGNDGQPVLIDPAVYFGNRECDLAMTQLSEALMQNSFSFTTRYIHCRTAGGNDFRYIIFIQFWFT